MPWSPTRCEICEFDCSQKNNLNTHMASVHEGKIVPEGKDHFKCVFSSIDANNVIQHEGKKSCRFCT